MIITIIKIIKKYFLEGILGIGILGLIILGKKQPSPPPEKPAVEGIQYVSRVSATVGENFLTLTGWTSPKALVSLTNSLGSLSTQTLADSTGFFLFKFIFLPNKIGELSLIAQDTNGLVSAPLFLPEPPPNQDVFIENVLLAPTLGLAKSEILPGETAGASGKTVPHSKVLVYQYLDPKTTFWRKIKEFLIKSVMAKTAPILEVEADDGGNFEFNLPSTEPADLKIFVASIFQKPQLPSEENYSPKSFTLSFKTLSFWELMANFLLSILLKIYLLAKKIAEDPTRIIWLEIPILGFLFIKVGLRGITEKILER